MLLIMGGWVIDTHNKYLIYNMLNSVMKVHVSIA